MIIKKSRDEIARMARAGAVVARMHEALIEALRPGMSTLDLDRIAEDVVLNRLEVYRKQTEPLEHFYWERGLLRDVEAVGEVDDVSERALSVLQDYTG